MSQPSRRSFLKKNVLGGLGYTFGAALIPSQTSFGLEDTPILHSFANTPYDAIDWTRVRNEFKINDDIHYFNTSSLGPSPKIVINKVCDTLKELELEVKHGHHLTMETHEQLGRFLNTKSDQIAITRNTTEGLNSIARMVRLKRGDEVILTTHEHVGCAFPWFALQKDNGVKIKLVNLDLTGENNLELIKSAISRKTKVVVFSHITCTNGMRLPAKEIAAFCKSKGVYSCVDGAQALGMFPIDLADIDPDFYAASGHKWLFGPKGTGILYYKKELLEKFDPVYVGAYSDAGFDYNETKLQYNKSAQREEYGTRNTPLILGLGSAIDFMTELGMENVARRGQELADYFRKSVAKIPKIEVLTPVNPIYSSAIVTIRIKDFDNRNLSLLLDEKYRIKLRSIYENDLNALRLSFSIFNDFNEIDFLCDRIKESITE